MGNKNIRGSTEWEKKFLDNFNKLCNRHRSWQVWQDFVHMSACAISNAMDRRPDVWKAREDSYLATVKRYSKEDLDLIGELFGITISALEENPAQDFLGKLYMQLDFGDGWRGQFFTPWHVAELMAKMTAGEDLVDSFGNEIKEMVSSQGYVSVYDSCCGAGCMLLAFANACKEEFDVNYQKDVIFVGQDIDPVVAKMCYIQISLVGCPGYVVIGNSLTEPIRGRDTNPVVADGNAIWYTPLWFVGLWAFRFQRKTGADHVKTPVPESEDEKPTDDPPRPRPPKQSKPITNHFQKKNFSLFDFFTKR